MDPNGGGCMPEEILFDILTMLPVKSLCRFRCVSKSWFAIISSPDFVAAHLARSRSRPKLLISVRYIDDRRNKVMCRFFSIDYPEQDMNNRQPLRPTSYRSTEFGDSAMISSSPTGLICFTCSDGIKIGNPMTGAFDVIPYPISDPSTALLFGFDPVEKSHVILKIEDHDYTTDADLGRSGVFDLLENYWHVSEPHPWMAAESAICIDGVIYFTAAAEDMYFAQFDCLYAFDIRLKSFQMIERPPDSLDRSFVVELLIEYKGRIAFVGYGNARDTTVDQICLWILEDPKKKHIWSFKSFVVPWRENLMRDGISTDGLASFNSGGIKVKLFGATHRGELILATPLSRGSLYLFFYEIETNSLRRFKVDGFSVNPCACDPCACDEARFNFMIESLQSPKGLRRRRKRAAFINLHPSCS